ncbi:hypothetical protein GCM10010441_71210 [Kitasatospora paracochleata]|uniref:DUF4419 domain-containing protein n=1 Tax=Kitasatospora paracochleata TaxID=58354 RepID=A0ABT1J569_9ACTN|nr:DUF4419 domain-containing protein [Kitasatospora paracochleata]MCP2312570.1 hypothetical protein [Kitasatospora paracochleata]
MAIEIDLPLAPDAGKGVDIDELADTGNEAFLRAVLRRPVSFHHRSTERLDGGVPAGGSTDSLLLRAVHLCFAGHLPLSLSPDLLWYTVVHEVATHVKLQPARYEGMFTDTPGRVQDIVVHDDAAPSDWQRSIGLVREPLRKRIGAEQVELFEPAFSTTTPVEAAVALVALMDVVSSYYRFHWITLCGIPRIRLEGTAEDWRLLADRVRELARRFTALAPWFAALHPVLETIAGTAAGEPVDQEFWRSLYKYRTRSGGAWVTGWINAFFAHRHTQDGPVPKEDFGPDEDGWGSEEAGDFPSHVSQVPFLWHTLLGTFEMAFLAGVLGIERDGEWIRPRLGNAVVELLPTPRAEDLLPEGWTLAEIRRLAEADEVELMPLLGEVTLLGKPIDAEYAIEVDGSCLVRGRDGDWYIGEQESGLGDVRCEERVGPDLGAALKAL